MIVHPTGTVNLRQGTTGYALDGEKLEEHWDWEAICKRLSSWSLAEVMILARMDQETERAIAITPPIDDDRGTAKGMLPEAGAEWPPDDGWHFAGASFSFRGKEYDLRNKPLALLRAMVGKRRTSFTRAELLSEFWGGDEAVVTEGAVNKQLNAVRDALRIVAKDIGGRSTNNR